MFSLGIRYLMGWAMAAADGARKAQAEWPPHPDRVFMALAAAWFETGRGDQEGDALRWLEGLPPPKLSASGMCPRSSVTHFVPVNDSSQSAMKTIRAAVADEKTSLSKLKDSGLSQLPEFRSRQARSFPVAIPFDPDVHLIWDSEVPPQHRMSIERLCRMVTSIGHSASLVQMWLEENPPSATLVPLPGPATHRMRVFSTGRLRYLEARLNRDTAVAYADMQAAIQAAKGKAKTALQQREKELFPNGSPSSLRPEPGRWQGYARPDSLLETAAAARTVFDDRLIVLALSGPRLPLVSSLKLMDALRGAIMSMCSDPLPEWLSGHAVTGQATRQPHVALLPMPFTGANRADGRMMGVALALPRDLDPGEAARVLEPCLRDENGLPRRIRLFDGHWLECEAMLETREAPAVNLRAQTWTGPSRRWASVTPVVLDRHFDGPDKWERAAESVKDACERVGLPRPLDVVLHPVSLVEGVPRSHDFPAMTRKRDGGRMQHIHAVLVFAGEVVGPVLLGAGRFRGYGLCRPLMTRGSDHG